MSYNYKGHVQTEVMKCQAICCMILQILRKQTSKRTQLKFNRTMSISLLLFESECWILRHKDRSTIWVSWNENPACS